MPSLVRDSQFKTRDDGYVWRGKAAERPDSPAPRDQPEINHTTSAARRPVQPL